MKIAIGCDHGGYDLKEQLKTALVSRGCTVEDVGTYGHDSVDYPVFAAEVARRVADHRADRGIVVCTSGIGVSITANRFPGVRAALCTNAKMAAMSRKHNNANVLALGQSYTGPEEALAILEAWLDADFEGGRHARRVKEIERNALGITDPLMVAETDPELFQILRAENRRQDETLNLVASENYLSRAVREATASSLTNKYADGYPGRRRYPGCVNVDEVERLAMDRARQLFHADHVNVQPYSGSSANLAVFMSVLKPGDTILAMDPAQGGHDTHGGAAHVSGTLYHSVHYGLDAETELLDYRQVEELAARHQPRLLCAGASAYPRFIDFKRMREIADGVGAHLLVDMAHISGLIAAGYHPNPVPHSDFCTTSTHKTLRGPRGGMILCSERFAAEVDQRIYPYTQGGPLMHVIAAKAVCLAEAMQPAFQDYQQQVVLAARALAEALDGHGLRSVTGGTDTHLLIVDLSRAGCTGREACRALEKAGILVNRVPIPGDPRMGAGYSGIRVGLAAAVTRGLRAGDMPDIAAFMAQAIKHPDQEKALNTLRRKVAAYAAGYPLP